MSIIGRMENKVMESIIEKMLAGFIERTCGNLITTIIGVLGLALGLVNQFGSSIPAQYHLTVNAVVIIVYGVTCLLAKDKGLPTASIPVVKPLAMVLLCLAMLGMPVAARAQAAPLPVNLYAGGVSYNVGASPSVAGTGLYARLIGNTGTYAFTVIDLLPNTKPTFAVSTNIGVGIAQKVAAIAGVPVYIPTSAGISLNGSNTGWAWSTGGTAVIDIKGHPSYKIMPTVRVAKSSVAGGTGYQPIVGVLFGWGQ